MCMTKFWRTWISINRLTTSSWWSTLTPFLTRLLMMSRCPSADARCSAVWPVWKNKQFEMNVMQCLNNEWTARSNSWNWPRSAGPINSRDKETNVAVRGGHYHRWRKKCVFLCDTHATHGKRLYYIAPWQTVLTQTNHFCQVHTCLDTMRYVYTCLGKQVSQ